MDRDELLIADTRMADETFYYHMRLRDGVPFAGGHAGEWCSATHQPGRRLTVAIGQAYGLLDKWVQYLNPSWQEARSIACYDCEVVDERRCRNLLVERILRIWNP